MSYSSYLGLILPRNEGGSGGGGSSSSFDLSDRMAKGIDNQGNVVEGAIKQGLIENTNMGGQTTPANIASGQYSHAEGYGTTANHKSQHVFGEFNTADSSTAESTSKGNYVEIVGNGTNTNSRSNARTLDWSGNQTLSGSLTLGKGTVNETTITASQLSALLSLSTAEGVTF